MRVTGTGTRRPGISALATVLVALLSLPLTPGPLAAPVDVSARTSLDVDVATIGRAVRVQGTLRDNVAMGLAQRAVSLSFRRPTGSPAPHTVELVTDRNGRFDYETDLPAGDWVVRVEYPGGRFHEPASESFDLTAYERTLTLTARLVDPIPLAFGQLVLELRVVDRETGEPPPEAVDVRYAIGCTGEGGTESLPAGEGAALVVIELPDGFGPGLCDVIARVPGDARYATAVDSSTTRMVDDVAVTLSAVELPHSPVEPPTWELAANVVADGEPLHDVAVRFEVLRGDSIVRGVEATTDADGLASAAIDGASLERGEHAVRARFVAPVGDGRYDVRSEPVVIVRPVSPFVAFRYAAIAMILLVLLAILVAIARERRAARPAPPDGDGARLPAEFRGELPRRRRRATPEPEPTTDAWVVSVVDAETGDPVAARAVVADAAGAWQVVVDTGPLGAVHVTRADARTLAVSAEAPGYLPTEETIPKPSDRDRIELRMTSVRSVVRDLFVALHGEIVGETKGEHAWGHATVAELADELRRAISLLDAGTTPGSAAASRRLASLIARLPELRAQGGRAAARSAVDALELIVDRIYFAERPPGREATRMVEQLAEIVRRGARGPETEAG